MLRDLAVLLVQTRRPRGHPKISGPRFSGPHVFSPSLCLMFRPKRWEEHFLKTPRKETHGLLNRSYARLGLTASAAPPGLAGTGCLDLACALIGQSYGGFKTILDF